MASEYPARGAAGQSAARAARGSAGRHAGPATPVDRAGPAATPSAPSPLPTATLRVIGDSLLTGLWTATRDLDDRPWRRRVARGALVLVIAPRAAAELRSARPQPPAPTAPPRLTAGDVARGARPDAPGARAADGASSSPLAWGVGGTLAALTLAGSHWVEAAAVRRLRDRGVPHPGTVLGVALGAVQLVATAGIEAAARRGSTSATRPSADPRGDGPSATG